MRRLLFFLFLSFLVTDVSAQLSKNISLLGNWNDTAFIHLNRIGQRYNDVWGFVQGGKEYAAIGSNLGVHIIDVNTTKQVAFQPGKDTGWNIVNRDYKTYSHYLYTVCDQGSSSMQVFDLNYLPDSIHLVWESDPAELMLCHTIFIDTANASLYACSVKGTNSGSDHMRVYSLTNPEIPALMTVFNLHDRVHAVFVKNDTAYCSSGNYGYEVIDFSKHDSSFQPTSELRNYPYHGYNHSSWINEKGFGVMADETHSSPLKVIDARDITRLRVLSTFTPRPNDSTCVPHNPYLIGDFAFISYYFDGLQIYDISNPESPKQAGYYDTYPGQAYKGYSGAWGCYPFLPSGKVLVSDMVTGLYIFDVTEAVKKKDTTVLDRKFKLYPNPFTDRVWLEMPKEDSGKIEIRLSDAGGKYINGFEKQVFNYTVQPIQLNLPGYLPAGTYLLQIQTGRNHYTEKITKR